MKNTTTGNRLKFAFATWISAFRLTLSIRFPSLFHSLPLPPGNFFPSFVYSFSFLFFFFTSLFYYLKMPLRHHKLCVLIFDFLTGIVFLIFLRVSPSKFVPPKLGNGKLWELLCVLLTSPTPYPRLLPSKLVLLIV